MKAIVVTHQAAGTAEMTLAERPDPEVAGDGVLGEVHASGFTPGELTWPDSGPIASPGTARHRSRATR